MSVSDEGCPGEGHGARQTPATTRPLASVSPLQEELETPAPHDPLSYKEQC